MIINLYFYSLSVLNSMIPCQVRFSKTINYFYIYIFINSYFYSLHVSKVLQRFQLILTRLHLQGKVARRAIVFNNLAQIMQSCTNPAISQIRNRHMRHVLNAHEHQFDKTPPNRAR